MGIVGTSSFSCQMTRGTNQSIQSSVVADTISTFSPWKEVASNIETECLRPSQKWKGYSGEPSHATAVSTDIYVSGSCSHRFRLEAVFQRMGKVYWHTNFVWRGYFREQVWVVRSDWSLIANCDLDLVSLRSDPDGTYFWNFCWAFDRRVRWAVRQQDILVTLLVELAVANLNSKDMSLVQICGSVLV